MKVCCCSLAGTRACDNCQNAPSSTNYFKEIKEWKKEMEKHYSDKRRVMVRTFTTTSLSSPQAQSMKKI